MPHRPFYAATTVRTGWCQESQVGLPATYITLIQKGDRNDKIKTQVDGSFRRLFEDVASQLGNSNSADEILGSLDDVRKKVAAHRQEQFFEPRLPAAEFHLAAASYNPAEPMAKRNHANVAPAAFGRLGCAFATIRYGATMFVHAYGSEEGFERAVMTSPASNNYACKCHSSCGSTQTQ